ARLAWLRPFTPLALPGIGPTPAAASAAVPASSVASCPAVPGATIPGATIPLAAVLWPRIRGPRVRSAVRCSAVGAGLRRRQPPQQHLQVVACRLVLRLEQQRPPVDSNGLLGAPQLGQRVAQVVEVMLAQLARLHFRRALVGGARLIVPVQPVEAVAFVVLKRGAVRKLLLGSLEGLQRLVVAALVIGLQAL